MLKFSYIGFLCFALTTSVVYAETIHINDAELEYEIKGNGDTTVLFEAGAISGMSGWDSIWSLLPQHITAIKYSRRGEGGSSNCKGDLSAQDYVQDVNVLVDKLNIDTPFVYVSHSYGGKIVRQFVKDNPAKVSGMLFIDPINPRDVEIIEQLDPENGQKANQDMKASDIAMGIKNNWCLIKDIWDKKPSLGYQEMGDYPMTLIAGVKKFKNPKRLFDRDKARELWGKVQAEWVEQFPRGKAVMATQSGHFVQDDQPELVIDELIKLLNRVE